MAANWMEWESEPPEGLTSVVLKDCTLFVPVG
jgi:hypothetical protein